MRKWLLLILAFSFAVGCGKKGCECVGTGTLALPPSEYKGDSDAKAPYIETGRLFIVKRGCTGNLCTYSMGMKPKLHNPLYLEVKATIQCQYWLDEGKLGHRKSDPVVVIARSTRAVQGFDYIFELPAGRPVEVGVECSADFGNIGTDTTPKSIKTQRFE